MSARALSPSAVREIRLDPRPSPEVAEEYGVSDSLVRAARIGLGAYADDPFPEGMPERGPGNRRRNPRPDVRGELHPHAVLSDEAVLALRVCRKRLGWTFRALRDFAVEHFRIPDETTTETIRKAVRGISWPHVPGAVR